ncbi:hypothetical protein [Pseudoxanthomonas kaohsiungensis]|uniref:RepB family plasmid replication initiator protein n=1 Tax=Pseudoxanthomonas kaohsiungensis TaxID=283923 RepID=A0ABW3M0M3_9GAMM|nr:hypothetical protein [Pseudoxanthomonas kaohsiungensis]
MKTAKTFTQSPVKVPIGQEPSADEPALYTQIPVSVLRCALFGVSDKGDDVADFTKVTVDRRLTGAEIRYKGPHLNQDHLKLWQACLFLAQETVGLNGDKFAISNTADLLRLSGRSTGDSRQYNRVWELLKDLVSAKVEISTSRTSYFGSLILEVAKDKPSGRIDIHMSGTLKQFMSNETLSNDMLRLAGLGKDQLASWLHNYYASQKEPPKLSISEIKSLSGSQLKLPQLRQRVKKAMAKLKCGSRPLITDFKLDETFDTLHVTKNPTTVDMRAADAVAAAAFEKRKAADAMRRERDKTGSRFKTQGEVNRPSANVVL